MTSTRKISLGLSCLFAVAVSIAACLDVSPTPAHGCRPGSCAPGGGGEGGSGGATTSGGGAGGSGGAG